MAKTVVQNRMQSKAQRDGGLRVKRKELRSVGFQGTPFHNRNLDSSVKNRNSFECVNIHSCTKYK